MRIPIRNKLDRVLTIFVELECDQYEVPVGGEAIIRLEDGHPHSVDIDDAWVTIWNEGGIATVEIIASSDKRVDDALMYARIWLHRLGAAVEASLIDDTVENLEISEGYFASRDQVFRAFHAGFLREDGTGSPGDVSVPTDHMLAACYCAGTSAGRLNRAAREAKSFPELGAAPFDTDTIQSAFAKALGNGR